MDTINSKFRNNIGEKHNRLYIMDIDEEKSQEKGTTYFKCKCDCGNEVSIRAAFVTSGRVLSCGCIRSENMRRDTEVYINDKKGYGVAFVNKKREDDTIDDDYFITFDVGDKDIVTSTSWHINNNGYVAGAQRGNYKNPKRILLHRAIVEKHEGDLGELLVDHIDHNKLELRYSNLRSCTSYENGLNGIINNYEVNQKENHLKYVWYDKKQNLYRVTFKKTIDGKTKKITKSSKSLDEVLEFRDKYIQENSRADFYYNNNIDRRDVDYYIGFPNEYQHPFYIVDNEDMTPPDPMNTICPFTDLEGNDISTRNDDGHRAIQPFVVLNGIRFNKGGR